MGPSPFWRHNPRQNSNNGYNAKVRKIDPQLSYVKNGAKQVGLKEDRKGDSMKKKLVAVVAAAMLMMGVVATGCSSEPAAPSVDKANLETAVADASGTNKNTYTAESYAALQDAIAQAQAVIDNADATQEQVTEAEGIIADAVAALVEKPKLTAEQKDAVGRVNGNMRTEHYSKVGLIAQLESEGFSNEVAVFAVDYDKPDFNAAALGKAQMLVNNNGVAVENVSAELEALGFTAEEIDYAVSNL